MLNKVRAIIEAKKTRSAWNKGVKAYAEELLDNLDYMSEEEQADAFSNNRMLERALLNGASDWNQYSWGGCSYCYDSQIAKALCNPSELKRTDNGRKEPNKSEHWLDVQARALFQACELIKATVAELKA